MTVVHDLRSHALDLLEDFQEKLCVDCGVPETCLACIPASSEVLYEGGVDVEVRCKYRPFFVRVSACSSQPAALTTRSLEA